jgi:hypothetical protein
MKKSRKAYMYLGEFTSNAGEGSYLFKVLMDTAEILDRQAALAVNSRYGKNKQDYGPFRVTLSVPKPPAKEKRRKK